MSASVDNRSPNNFNSGISFLHLGLLVIKMPLLFSRSDSISFTSDVFYTSLPFQLTSDYSKPAESQLISFVGQPKFVNTVYAAVGSSAFLINFFIFLVLFKERTTSNITEMLMINQVFFLVMKYKRTHTYTHTLTHSHTHTNTCTHKIHLRTHTRTQTYTHLQIHYTYSFAITVKKSASIK